MRLYTNNWLTAEKTTLKILFKIPIVENVFLSFESH